MKTLTNDCCVFERKNILRFISKSRFPRILQIHLFLYKFWNSLVSERLVAPTRDETELHGNCVGWRKNSSQKLTVSQKSWCIRYHIVEGSIDDKRWNIARGWASKQIDRSPRNENDSSNVDDFVTQRKRERERSVSSPRRWRSHSII